jgi:uncharacterized protein (DUF362 family)
MRLYFTRRNFISSAPAALLATAPLRAQTADIPVGSVAVRDYPQRSTVALTGGDNRRKNVYEAILALDDQLRPKMLAKKRVVIKVNNVSTQNQLAATHADALRGILDYVVPRFKGPITICESSAGDTWTGFRNFGYPAAIQEYKTDRIELIDLNEEGKYVSQPLLDQDAHLVAVRLGARLLDRDAFVIGSAMLKSHNYAVVTLSIKNMVLGAPLHSPMKAPAKERFNGKVMYHAGFHLVHVNMLWTAQSMQPHWGLSVIDGYEGMEGNGPASGTPVASRLAIASPDFIASDRVAVECMGVNPDLVGYLVYCGQMGLGNYDLAKIDIRGASIASVQKKYRLHSEVDTQLQWTGPLDVQDGSWIGPRGRRTDGPRRSQPQPQP